MSRGTCDGFVHWRHPISRTPACGSDAWDWMHDSFYTGGVTCVPCARIHASYVDQQMAFLQQRLPPVEGIA